MKRWLAIASILLTVPSTSFAAWTCNGCSATNVVVIGDVTVSGSSSTINRVSVLGDFTVNAELTGITITNTVIDGTPTLGSDADTNQWASTAEVAGAGTPSEAVIALTASPYMSPTDLRLNRNATTLHDAATAAAADIRGILGDSIGAYNSRSGIMDLGRGDLLKAYIP